MSASVLDGDALTNRMPFIKNMWHEQSKNPFCDLEIVNDMLQIFLSYIMGNEVESRA